MDTIGPEPITYMAEDESHCLLVYPWWTEPQVIDESLQLLKDMGYTDMTSEGNYTMTDSNTLNTHDWDYIRVEPAPHE